MDARTEEIRARVEKDLDMWARRLACYDGADRQELEKRQAWFRSELEQFTTAELTALREEVERLRAGLKQLDAAAGEVIAMEEMRYAGTPLRVEPWIDRLADAVHIARRAALSPSPAQQEEK